VKMLPDLCLEGMLFIHGGLLLLCRTGERCRSGGPVEGCAKGRGVWRKDGARSRGCGRLHDGDVVLLLAAGTGYTWAATVVRWGMGSW